MANLSSDSFFLGRMLAGLVLAGLGTSPVVSAADLPQSNKGKLEAAEEDFFEANIRPVLRGQLSGVSQELRSTREGYGSMSVPQVLKGR